MSETLYRRPLPAEAIAFSSPEGRQLFAEALAAGGLEGYFPLAEQFHTQSDPAFCGLGSLVVALNALGIDPGRLWKGPWRWFAEDLLDCCVPLDQVRQRGLDLDELACLARCNGADVDAQRADTTGLADAADTASLIAWRAALATGARGECVVVASYDRAALGQTGSGHFSPIGGYHAARDLALVLDVARFKYPPHWVAVEKLWRAMHAIDPVTRRPRGWMVLKRRRHGVALGYSVRCVGDSWQGLAWRLREMLAELKAAAVDTPADIAGLARAVSPLTEHLELRTPSTAAHQTALSSARGALRDLAVYPQVLAAVGEPERSEAVTLILLAVADLLSPPQRATLGAATGTGAFGDDSPGAAELKSEIANVRAQVMALLRQSPANDDGALATAG